MPWSLKSSNLPFLFRRKHRSYVINEKEPTYQVVYLGNVMTTLGKGDGAVDKALALIWKTHLARTRPDLQMKLTVTRSGLKAETGPQGLTEYWSHRITFCTAPKSYPKLFCWIYKHEGKKMKPELRCHAVLCKRSSEPPLLSTKLSENLAEALREYRREKISKQNTRLNQHSAGEGQPKRKQMLSIGACHFRPPVSISRSAPKLGMIEEDLEEPPDEPAQILTKEEENMQYYPFEQRKIPLDFTSVLTTTIVEVHEPGEGDDRGVVSMTKSCENRMPDEEEEEEVSAIYIHSSLISNEADENQKASASSSSCSSWSTEEEEEEDLSVYSECPPIYLESGGRNRILSSVTSSTTTSTSLSSSISTTSFICVSVDFALQSPPVKDDWSETLSNPTTNNKNNNDNIALIDELTDLDLACRRLSSDIVGLESSSSSSASSSPPFSSSTRSSLSRSPFFDSSTIPISDSDNNKNNNDQEEYLKRSGKDSVGAEAGKVDIKSEFSNEIETTHYNLSLNHQQQQEQENGDHPPLRLGAYRAEDIGGPFVGLPSSVVWVNTSSRRGDVGTSCLLAECDSVSDESGYHDEEKISINDDGDDNNNNTEGEEVESDSSYPVSSCYDDDLNTHRTNASIHSDSKEDDLEETGGDGENKHYSVKKTVLPMPISLNHLTSDDLLSDIIIISL